MKAPESPYLTAVEAALYLRYERADGSANMNAFYVARHRHQIKAHRRGRKLLFRRVDLDAFLGEERRELEAFVRRGSFGVLHADNVVRRPA